MSEIMVICGHLKFYLRTDDPRFHAGGDSFLVCLRPDFLLADERISFQSLGWGGGGLKIKKKL